MIADPDAGIAKAYGTFLDKWEVSTRATVVIGEDGYVLRAYPEAPRDGTGHAEAVYEDLAAELG